MRIFLKLPVDIPFCESGLKALCIIIMKLSKCRRLFARSSTLELIHSS